MSRATGPTPTVRKLVWARDDGHCAWCGFGVNPGDHSLQHRRSRGMGGTRRADANSPANLILMCGSATTGCHGWIEAHPTEAAARGFRLLQRADPTEIPALYADGTWLLGHDGSRTAVERTETAGRPASGAWGGVPLNSGFSG